MDTYPDYMTDEWLDRRAGEILPSVERADAIAALRAMMTADRTIGLLNDPTTDTSTSPMSDRLYSLAVARGYALTAETARSAFLAYSDALEAMETDEGPDSYPVAVATPEQVKRFARRMDGTIPRRRSHKRIEVVDSMGGILPADILLRQANDLLGPACPLLGTEDVAWSEVEPAPDRSAVNHWGYCLACSHSVESRLARIAHRHKRANLTLTRRPVSHTPVKASRRSKPRRDTLRDRSIEAPYTSTRSTVQYLAMVWEGKRVVGHSHWTPLKGNIARPKRPTTVKERQTRQATIAVTKAAQYVQVTKAGLRSTCAQNVVHLPRGASARFQLGDVRVTVQHRPQGRFAIRVSGPNVRNLNGVRGTAFATTIGAASKVPQAVAYMVG